MLIGTVMQKKEIQKELRDELKRKIKIMMKFQHMKNIKMTVKQLET